MYKACTIKKHFVYCTRILKLKIMFGKLSETKTKLLQTSPTFSISDVFFNYGATSFSRFNFLENGKVKTMSADQRKSWRTDEQIFEGVFQDAEKFIEFWALEDITNPMELAQDFMDRL